MGKRHGDSSSNGKVVRRSASPSSRKNGEIDDNKVQECGIYGKLEERSLYKELVVRGDDRARRFDE